MGNVLGPGLTFAAQSGYLLSGVLTATATLIVVAVMLGALSGDRVDR